MSVSPLVLSLVFLARSYLSVRGGHMEKEYCHKHLATIGVDDESTHGRKLAITVGFDTLGMCTISFGTSFSIRIPEDDVGKFGEVLERAHKELLVQRIEEEFLLPEDDDTTDTLEVE